MIHIENDKVHLAGLLEDTIAEAMIVVQNLYEYLRFIDKDVAEKWLDGVPDSIRRGAEKAPLIKDDLEISSGEIADIDDDAYLKMLGEDDDDY